MLNLRAPNTRKNTTKYKNKITKYIYIYIIW